MKAPAPHKAEAKAKAMKAKKTVLKGIHSHKEIFMSARDTATPKATQISPEDCPQAKRACPLCLYQVLLTTVRHEKERRPQTLMFHCGCQDQQAPGQTSCEEAL